MLRASTRSSLLLAALAAILPCAASAASLSAATLRLLGITANDLAYDSTRDALYATVPSAAGLPDGNSIVTIDPVTGTTTDSVFAGSEPTEIAVSDDGSRAYVGIDGATSFRSWQPGTESFGELVELRSEFGDPAVAEDLAIVPGEPGTVVVSKDERGSSADGDLEVFSEGSSVGGADDRFAVANDIDFVDADTLVSFNHSHTGFELIRWSLGPGSPWRTRSAASSRASGPRSR